MHLKSYSDEIVIHMKTNEHQDCNTIPVSLCGN